MLNLALVLSLLLWHAPLKADVQIENEATCKERIVKIQAGVSNSPSRAQTFTDLSFYILNGLSPDKSCRITASLEVTCSVLHSDVCRILPAQTSSLAYQDLRDYYQSNHINTVSVRKHESFIKPTLTEFTLATNYYTWTRHVVKRSNVKHKTRVIYRSPANFPQQISVSETLDTADGDLTAIKLETEIAIRRHGGEHTFEFYTYDEHGDLSEFSEFPAGERPSPTVCVACHYNPNLRTVSRFLPSL